MMARVIIALGAALAGLAVAVVFPSIPRTARGLVGLPATEAEARAPAPAPARASGENHADEGRIAMTSEQVTAAGIQVMAVQGGTLINRVAVPGVLAASQDRLARVTARVSGTVAEVRRGLGEEVARGDVLAVIESREIADAKGEYLAALRTTALAETTLARETRLWRQRISAEQDFLQARTTAEEARIRLDLGRQRLSALSLSEAEVAALPNQPVATLRRLEIRAPIPGRVTARTAVLGAAVGADAELYTVADLSRLWVEMAVPPRDLPMARQGQAVTVTSGGDARVEGRIVFLSPVLDPETRSARAVAEIPNQDGNWQPGGFVTAQLATDEQSVGLIVPREAVQEIEGQKVVFVRTPEGFEKRAVVLGREDRDFYEVRSGLDPGIEIAVGNAFVLRAELGKSEAGDSH